MLKSISLCCALIAIPSAAWGQDSDVADLIKMLRSGNAGQQISAADQAAALGAKASDAVGALTKLMSSANADVRWHAARSLGSIGRASSPAVPNLVKGLKDENAKVRTYSAFALGEAGDDSNAVVEALTQAFLDEDPLVRRAVRDAVRDLNVPPEITLPLMVKVLENADSAAVLPALHTLAEAGEASLPGLINALDHPTACYWACIVAAELGPIASPAVPKITKVLGHEHPECRMQALMALGHVGDAGASAVPKILELLQNDEYEGVKYAAIFALGNMNDRRAVSALTQSAHSEDQATRVLSAWALIRLDPRAEIVEKGLAEILKGFESDDERVRDIAARALVDEKMPREAVRPVISAAVKGADQEFINLLVGSLASLGAESVPAATMGLDNPDVRIYAAQVLYQIGPDAKDAVPRLIKSLNDPDPEFRREVEFALGAIGEASAPAVPQLIANLSDSDVEVRHAACYALAKIGPAARSAIEPLSKNLRSDDQFFRIASIWAMLKIRPGNERIMAVAVPLLTEALTDSREHVRAEAAASLGDIGKTARSALPALKRAQSSDDSPLVRDAATGAIKQIEG